MNAPAMNTPNPEQVTSRPNLSQARQLVVCEAGGDPAKITGPADAQVESGRQTVPSETRSEPRSGQNGWEPDPFGQIFAGKRMAKLPNRPLNRLGVQLLEKAEALGVTLDDDATVYWGAACITLMQAGFQPRTSFFVAICQRLSQCAEGADDLGEFLAALHPGLLCEKTAVGYTVERDGKLISWRGSVAAQYYVEIFVLKEGVRWQTAAQEGSQEGQGPSRPPDHLLQHGPQAASLAPEERKKKRSRGQALLDSLSPVRRRRKLDDTQAPSPSRNKDKDGRSLSKRLSDKLSLGKKGGK